MKDNLQPYEAMINNSAGLVAAAVTFSLVLSTIPIGILPASGHGVAVGGVSRFYEIDNEFFLPHKTIVGETIVITGELASRVNRPLTLEALPIFDKNTNSSVIDDFPPSWQLVKMSLPKTFTLPAGEDLPFEIEIRALREGTFHLHTAFNATGIGLSLARGQTVTVYSDKQEFNEKENSFYMLTIDGKNHVIQYEFRGSDNNHLSGKKVQSIVANPQNMSMDIKLSDTAVMIEDGRDIRQQTRSYFDLILQGDNLEMLSYPSKFSVYVNGKSIQPEDTNLSCSYYYLRIPISSNSKEIMLRGSINTDIPDEWQTPHTRIMQPLTVATVQPQDNNDGQGRSNTRHYYFEVGIATNANRCSVAVIDLLQVEKRLHIYLDGVPSENAEQRFLSLAIPEKLLGGNYTVLIDDKAIGDFQLQTIDGSVFEHGLDPQVETSKAWNIISLNYTSDTRGIDIIGTTAIPEFHSYTIVGAAMLLIVIAGIIAAVKRGGMYDK